MALRWSDALPFVRTFVRRDTLFVFDYDGTLAPICDDPDLALPTEGMRAALSELAGLACVGVLSGRSRSSVEELLGVNVAMVVGNHGFESPFVLDGLKEEATEIVAGWEKRLSRAFERCDLLRRGVRIESKGLSLCIHFRGVADRGTSLCIIMDELGHLAPTPRLQGGKECVNVLHPSAPHKGDALAEMMRNMGSPRAVFMGDDVTDEDVFELRSPNVLGIRVGVSDNTKAQLFVDGQWDVLDVIRCFSDRLGGCTWIRA